MAQQLLAHTGNAFSYRLLFRFGLAKGRQALLARAEIVPKVKLLFRCGMARAR